MGDLGSVLGLGRSPGKGNGCSLQYSCLENSTDRGDLQAWLEWLSLSYYHFLISLGLFSVGLLLLLCFLPREVPLTFVIKLVWWYWILLTFTCLESFWYLNQIWRRVLLDNIFLVVGSSLSFLKIYCAIPFSLVELVLRNSAGCLMGVLLYVI